MSNLYPFLSDYKNIVHNIIQNLPLCSSQLKTHIRNVIYESHKGINASATAKSIQYGYVVDVIE